MTRTEFLREEAITSRNKAARRAMPAHWSTAELGCGLCERKALGTAMILEHMPVFIGERELIVGTRTLYRAAEGNADNHDVSAYHIDAHPAYANAADIAFFGADMSFHNKTHYTPDYGILLGQGIGGILHAARQKLQEGALLPHNRDFLKGVIAVYEGLSTLITRYAELAGSQAKLEADPARAEELRRISAVCRNVARQPASDFHEAVQLLWFGQLAAIIESFQFVNYGRLDVILGKYLGDCPPEEARQLVDCFVLKTYDQVDLKNDDYLNRYAAQLNITLGGVDTDGRDAVNAVTYLFLESAGRARLPEPLIALRIHSLNPPEFLQAAAKLSIGGANNLSYYNDDLFTESLIGAGVRADYARDYAFDLCQDITIPGKGDYYMSVGIGLIWEVLDFLQGADDGIESFDEFMDRFKACVSGRIRSSIEDFNKTQRAFTAYAEGDYTAYTDGVRSGAIGHGPGERSPMCPLPLLSALYEGCIETARDLSLDQLPDRNKGCMINTPVEGINSLAVIRRFCFEERQLKLSELRQLCQSNYECEGGEAWRQRFIHVPKWGNDDDTVDAIGKDILEFMLREFLKYPTEGGGRHLGGIHQPHPVPTGLSLPATPDGRKACQPVAVTLTAQNGTMRNGATAALNSAAKLDWRLIQWNNCVMVSYFSSVFGGPGGADLFVRLLSGYFKKGGMQHQPNVIDTEALRAAQASPEAHRDLVVRLWGVSAHFVDLPRDLQDEIILRLPS